MFFFAGGVGIGAWASSLPLLSARMSLEKAQLGIVLLCFALGAIVLMVNVGRYIDRFRIAYPLSYAGSLVFASALSFVPFVETQISLAVLVFAAGAGFGTLDVAMNTEASEIERETDEHMMSSFHALFSIGNIAGASLVGIVVAYGGALRECLLAGSALVVFSTLLTQGVRAHTSSRRQRETGTGVQDGSSTLDVGQKSLVFVLGAVAFLAFLAEGGMLDWTAIYMVEIIGSSESVGAFAFAIFAGAMSVGRLVGDTTTRRVGHINVLRAGGAVCAVSLFAMLIMQNAGVSLVVLAICGFGVANMIPVVFASAGRVGASAAGKAMSVVTTMGYSGLLLGPAVLGFVAQVSNLNVALALVALAFTLIAAGTLHLERRFAKHHTAPQAGD